MPAPVLSPTNLKAEFFSVADQKIVKENEQLKNTIK